MINKLKAKLLLRWASDFGLTLVKITRVGDTEYLVAPNGTHYKLARKGSK